MKKNKIKVLLSGCSFSGNKGAEAMYDSIIDGLKEYYENIDVTILSKYPEDDAAGCAVRGYKLIPFSTVEQIFYGGCFYIIGGFFKKLHLPYKWLSGKRTHCFFENDIMIDSSGIAFTDDRSFVNILINALWFIPALISGIPIVKVSQTLGPFTKKYVKFFSNLVLRRINVIICRGKLSYDYVFRYLKERDNIYNLPDTAFCLKPCGIHDTEDLLSKYDLKADEFIAIGPSFMMDNSMKCSKYTEIMSSSINKLAQKTDKKIVFIPHSWKHSVKAGVDSVSDDLSVCEKIADNLDPCVKYSVLSNELSAREYKSIIGASYMAVGSRYHFLIAALSSGVPCAALGWSHKYNDLFDEFGLEEYVLRTHEISDRNATEKIITLFERRDEVKHKIGTALPELISRSKQNEKLIFEYLEKIK